MLQKKADVFQVDMPPSNTFDVRRSGGIPILKMDTPNTYVSMVGRQAVTSKVGCQKKKSS
jgi:hypothetical protein